jgi:predicted dehydrogenase
MNKMTRRDSLKLMATGLTAPLILPRMLRGAEAPSNTLRLASIGTGRMGHGDMKECVYNGLDAAIQARVVAVCDLDLNRARHAAAEVEGIYSTHLSGKPQSRVKVYQDFRALLAKEELDGITISTPDHWHALLAIAAAKAGKDIYIQKPLTYSMGEGQQLVKAVRENNVVLQTGSQQRSSVYFRTVCERVRNGRIGTLREIHVGLPEDHGSGTFVESPVPDNLDYDMWLGPRPVVPYTPHGVHPISGYGRPGWLQIEAYCRGMITGWGAHMNDIAQWGHGSDDGGLVEIQASAEFPARGLFNVHTKFQAEGTYADGVKLFQKTGAAGVKFVGDDGWLFVNRGSMNASNRDILREKLAPDETHLYVSANHMKDFLSCMRTRKDPICPVEVGHRSNSICVMTHIAMKLGRKLNWDPKAERFVNDDAANALLDYEHRAPWQV